MIGISSSIPFCHLFFGVTVGSRGMWLVKGQMGLERFPFQAGMGFCDSHMRR